MTIDPTLQPSASEHEQLLRTSALLQEILRKLPDKSTRDADAPLIALGRFRVAVRRDGPALHLAVHEREETLLRVIAVDDVVILREGGVGPWATDLRGIVPPNPTPRRTDPRGPATRASHPTMPTGRVAEGLLAAALRRGVVEDERSVVVAQPFGTLSVTWFEDRLTVMVTRGGVHHFRGTLRPRGRGWLYVPDIDLHDPDVIRLARVAEPVGIDPGEILELGATSACGVI